MQVEGQVFAILGALDAFPRRMAARAIRARGGTARRGLSRGTDIAVVGHRMAETWELARIIGRLKEARSAGARLISEAALLRLLGLAAERPAGRELSKEALAEAAGLDNAALELLALFDAFDTSEAPFGFRDLVAARQYARLIGEGVDWRALVHAVHGSGRDRDGSISELRLERTGWNTVVARSRGALTELDGQHLLPLPAGEDPEDADDLFEEAEAAEARGDLAGAAALYRRCLALDPVDPVIPFNLSHVLAEQGDLAEARLCLNRVLKLDPGYAEAWYNLADLARRRHDLAAARRHLEKAIAADPRYPDPVYNLALLDFEAGDRRAAARLWRRYLELDPDSDWADKARNGLRLIALLERGDPDAAGPRQAGPRGARMV